MDSIGIKALHIFSLDGKNSFVERVVDNSRSLSLHGNKHSFHASGTESYNQFVGSSWSGPTVSSLITFIALIGLEGSDKIGFVSGIFEISKSLHSIVGQSIEPQLVY